MKINPKTTNTILNITLQNDAVKLILQTLLDAQDLEGEYTIQGELTLVKKEN